jgi:hypothetical protein
VINKDNFLETIFADATPDEFICVSEAKPKSDGTGSWFNNCLPTDRSWRKWDSEKQARAWYFCVSTITGEMNDKGTMVRRGRGQLVKAHCLVLDDIGTKADRPPVEPSWILESSTGNEQWGYMLYPTGDLDRYEALLEYCHRQGWGDAGAGGSYRLMRVPGSANLKPGRGNFRAVVSRWEPDVWELDELITDLGATEDDLVIKTSTVNARAGMMDLDVEGLDPMLTWLADQGMVVEDKGQWVDITCPWADQHTSGDGTAGYSPLGRGEGEWKERRSFNCLHEHCKDRKLKELVKWAEPLGGPFVSGYDPLPWLQAQYVYVNTGQQVVDIKQRPNGGVWEWELADWAKKHPGRVTVAGHDKPILVASAFVESRATTKVEAALYRPVSASDDTGLTHDYGQLFVNTYVPPNWVETWDEPTIFLRHMDFLLPNKDERELVLDWLAYKFQHPQSRSYAVVMVAEDSYGTGRSWLKDMITNALRGHVKSASLAQLIGKGTSAEQTYNDWMACCQFLVVEEAKDTISREDFYHGYEVFKQMVDTKVLYDQRINPKYGRTRVENIYYNALIFTNHADALSLPEGCRRTYCVENPQERLSYAYYDELTASLSTAEPSRVYWWLMHRDVTEYDNIYPPMTRMKAAMIESSRPPSDLILEWIIDNHKSDIVTRSSLRGAVVQGARELDFSHVMTAPEGVTRMIWRKIKTLREVEKGARYTIKSKQEEIRAIRNVLKWRDVDQRRDIAEIESELDAATIGIHLVRVSPG